MKRLRIVIPVLLVFFVLFASLLLFRDFDHHNEAIYFGGTILTIDDRQPTAQAVFVKDGKIVLVGSAEAVLGRKTPRTRMVNLEGATLLPGFFDAHGHLDISTIVSGMADLSGFSHKTPAQVWGALSEAAGNTPRDEWIFGRGYDPILTAGLKPPSRQFLDSIAPHHPVVIFSQSLHFYYANSEAFRRVGIGDSTPDPSGTSYYERDANGSLTGLIVEQDAFEPFRLQLQQRVMKTFARDTQRLMDGYASRGITSIVTMGLTGGGTRALLLYEHLSAQYSRPLYNLLQLAGMLPQRKPNPRHFVYLRDRDRDLLPSGPGDAGDDFYRISGIKLWYDGSPYAASMYMSEPYLPSEFISRDLRMPDSHKGAALMTPDHLREVVSGYLSGGWQVAVHTQGDQAIREVLDVFGELHRKTPLQLFRLRLEHCLLLPADVMPRMREMNVTPSFHINHLLYYGQFLKSDIIGADRTDAMLPIHTFAGQGVPYSLHADAPMFESNPLSLISTAVNRRTESGQEIAGGERITAMEAIRAVTIHAAWQLGMEKKLGSIEEGKYADFVILGRNPLQAAPGELATIPVLETVVAGNTLWRK